MHGEPELLSRLSQYSQGIMPISRVSGSDRELQVSDLVPARRKIIAYSTARIAFLDRYHFSHTPSVSNHFYGRRATAGKM